MEKEVRSSSFQELRIPTPFTTKILREAVCKTMTMLDLIDKTQNVTQFRKAISEAFLFDREKAEDFIDTFEITTYYTQESGMIDTVVNQIFGDDTSRLIAFFSMDNIFFGIDVKQYIKQVFEVMILSIDLWRSTKVFSNGKVSGTLSECEKRYQAYVESTAPELQPVSLVSRVYKDYALLLERPSDWTKLLTEVLERKYQSLANLMTELVSIKDTEHIGDARLKKILEELKSVV